MKIRAARAEADAVQSIWAAVEAAARVPERVAHPDRGRLRRAPGGRG